MLARRYSIKVRRILRQFHASFCLPDSSLFESHSRLDCLPSDISLLIYYVHILASSLTAAGGALMQFSPPTFLHQTQIPHPLIPRRGRSAKRGSSWAAIRIRATKKKDRRRSPSETQKRIPLGFVTGCGCLENQPASQEIAGHSRSSHPTQWKWFLLFEVGRSGSLLALACLQ